MLDPKILLLLATGTLLLLNGLIARTAASKQEATADAPPDGTPGATAAWPTTEQPEGERA